MKTDTRRMSAQQTSADGMCWEGVNAGSLQRIADATEKMAENVKVLFAQRDDYKRSFEAQRARADKAERQVRVLNRKLRKLERSAQ